MKKLLGFCICVCTAIVLSFGTAGCQKTAKKEKDKEEKKTTETKKEETKKEEAKREETWDDLVSETAAIRARQTITEVSPLGKAFNSVQKDRVSTTCPSPLAEKRDRGVNANEKRLKKLLTMLTTGDNFKKYKHKKAKNRAVWCTPLLDFILWGDNDHNTVKGYIAAADVQEVNQGFGKNKCRIYLVTHARTLELECKSAEMAKEWMSAFEFLVQSQVFEKEKRKDLLKLDTLKKELDSCRAEHLKLLTEGDVFKKWPSRKMIQKGSFTIRRIWCGPKLDKVCWGDIGTNKVKGFIQMEDVVQVIEDFGDPEALKFTVVAVARSLDLEAKSSYTRQRWVRAIRYFINERKIHSGSGH